MIRVYLPATVTTLRQFYQVGELWPAPLGGYAVTSALQESYADDDVETLEYEAFSDAALASIVLIGSEILASADAPARRVVLSADIPESKVVPAPDRGPAGVLVDEPIDADMLVAVHIDSRKADGPVRLAASALPAAEAGDPEAQQLVDSVEEYALEWYDSSELEALVQAE